MGSGKNIGIVGAGFSGAVIADALAKEGFNVEVFEQRSHVAGNCHTERDNETNVMVHVYGPHIFHTNNETVWNYVNGYSAMMPFVNRVKALSGGGIYSLPINLMTINQFFGKTFSPAEAKMFLAEIGDGKIENPVSFEDQALRFLGKDLYEAFFFGYTLKQWGLHPSELPASILKRLPVRFNYDDNYYNSKFQGIPEDGYTAIVENILDQPNITVHLNRKFESTDRVNFDHVFFSGPLDEWFGFSFGRLAYRSLRFETERLDGDFQGNPVINYCDRDVPWTRISEHKHFAPWESHEQTLIYREYSTECGPDDIPYYPVRLVKDKTLLRQYIDAAQGESGVTFVGRLGTYRYLDMHITIQEAADAASAFLEAWRSDRKPPAFVVDPLA